MARSDGRRAGDGARGSTEDSGLIDLDELMRRAESSPSVTAAAEADTSGVRLAAPAFDGEVERVGDRERTGERGPNILRQAAPSASRRGPRGVVLVAGAAVVAAAVGLGAVAWSSGGAPAETSSRAARAAAVAPMATTTAGVERAAVGASPAGTGSAAIPGDEPSLGPEDLPSLAGGASPRAPARPTSNAGPAHPPAPASDPAAAAPAASAAPAAPAGAPGDLGSAMRSAVGERTDGDDQGARTAATAAPFGARQLHPSPGAVVGAINAVLPSARACLGPDDPVTTGAVVFGGDGTVSRVELHGDRPTGACVRRALSRARVEPFSDPSFIARVTVRP